MPVGYDQKHNRPAKQLTIKIIAAQNKLRVNFQGNLWACCRCQARSQT